MYIGTLDRKLLIINENSGDIVGEISLGGIPRTTVLSADKTKLHVVTTQMQVETVDLAARQVISSFPLSDGKSNPRMTRGAGGRGFSGIAVDPAGRYLYATISLAVKELDQFRIDPPQFVQIDLQEKKIGKSIPFPPGYDQGFGFAATYKISPDGKDVYKRQLRGFVGASAWRGSLLILLGTGDTGWSTGWRDHSDALGLDLAEGEVLHGGLSLIHI